MRKLIVSMNITLDGYVAGPNGELDWHFDGWTIGIADRLTKELSRADTILLGRVTYQAMAKYWAAKGEDLGCPRDDIAFAEMMNRYRKVVYSNTVGAAEWNNSKMIKGNIKKEITNLKNQPGKAIIVFGSGRLVSGLIKLNLIDEYQLWLHPVIIGKGKPLFKTLSSKINMMLIDNKTFDSGVVLLTYKPEKFYPNRLVDPENRYGTGVRL